MAINRMVNRVIGYEAANSYVKWHTTDAHDIYFNSLYRIPEGEETLMGAPTNDVPVNIFTLDGENFLAGTRRRGYTTSSSRGIERYASAEYRRESLIALAHAVNGNEALSVVTAIPADHYQDREQVEAVITETLRGDTGIIRMEVNGEPMSFGIRKVKTLLQPAATVVGIALDERGNVRKGFEHLTRNYKIVVDIGWGTTDVAVMEGLTVVRAFTIGRSMVDAYTRIDEKLKRDNSELRTMSYRELDIESFLRDGDTFSFGGKEYDCTDIKAEAFEWIAGEIMTGVGNGVKLREADAVIYTGGGVIPLSNDIKKFTDGVNALKADDPQGANARGCYNYGVAMK
ncbi:hypothetical protein [Paenibacillus sp. 1P03SA]|uniref:ParM/StbA family protein n=1 Tax=Paenibacillus sp. 1P03SA TaxID=3132294 RepID=UPI0039A23B43